MRERVLVAVFVLVVAGAGFVLYRAWTTDPLPFQPKPLESESAASAEPRGRARGMNLLLITLDTTRADHLGCYGYRQVATPCIDAMAANGLRFEHAIAPAPVTLPSHVTAMTGLDVPVHGVRNNASFRLDEKHTTLAEVLRAAGYATGAFVGAYVLDAQYGLAQGFDRYDDELDGQQIGRANNSFAERRAEAVVDSALAWFREYAARTPRVPYFAWLHLFDVHAPYSAPEPYLTQYRHNPYDGEIAYVDAQLARLCLSLRELQLFADTLIVLAADHGEGLGDHGEATHGCLLHDSTLRVPLIFSSPRLFSKARVESQRAIGLVDLLPSVLHLLGATCPAGLDGADFFAADPTPARPLYIETMMTYLDHGWASLHGLRRSGDKYVQGAVKEYYDLKEDPREDHNQYAPENEIARDLERELGAKMALWPNAAAVVAAERRLSPEEASRLAALGYARFQGAAVRGEKDPRQMLPLYHRALNADIRSRDGAHMEAIQEIQEVLAQDGENAEALYLASFIYKRAGRWEEAEACLRKGVALCPRSDGYVQLAQMLLQRRAADSPEFEEFLTEAHKLDAADGSVHCARGDAIALRASTLDPRTQLAEIEAAFRNAIREFEKALALDPSRSGEIARNQIQRAQSFLDRLKSQ